MIPVYIFESIYLQCENNQQEKALILEPFVQPSVDMLMDWKVRLYGQEYWNAVLNNAGLLYNFISIKVSETIFFFFSIN